MDLHRYEGHLNPKPPYEFEHSKRFIRQAYPGDAITDIDHTLLFPLLFQDQCLIVKLRSRGKVESPLLMLTVHSPFELIDEQFVAVQNRIRSFLSLDLDVQPLYSRGWDDDPFADILDEWYGYHQVTFESPFAAACFALLEQVRPGDAQRLWYGLMRSHGLFQKLDGLMLQAFPAAEVMAALPWERLMVDLRDEELTGRLQKLARAFKKLTDVPTESKMADEWLREKTDLDGAGRQLVLTRGFGLYDAIFQEKETILPLAQSVYGETIANDLAKRLAYYEGWQGYWLLHLQLAGLE